GIQGLLRPGLLSRSGSRLRAGGGPGAGQESAGVPDSRALPRSSIRTNGPEPHHIQRPGLRNLEIYSRAPGESAAPPTFSAARARGLSQTSSAATTASPLPATRKIPLGVNADSFRSERGGLQQLVEALRARVLVHRQLDVLHHYRVHARGSPRRLLHHVKP